MRRPVPAALLAAALACALASARATPAGPEPAAPPVAAADDATARTLDFRQAWQAALAHDATLRAARAGADAGREGVAVARAAGRPQVTLSASREHHDALTRPGELRQSYYGGTQSLAIRQALFQPVQDATLAQALAQADEGEAAQAQARQQLAVRLAEAYFELLLSQDQLDLVQAQTAAHARQLDAARKAWAAGSGTRTDIDEAQARLDLDAAETLRVEQQRERARLQLRHLVGEPFGRVAALDPVRFDAMPLPDEGMDAWIDEALRASPEVQAMQARRDAAAREVDKARARHAPTLDLVAQRTRSQSESLSRIGSRSTSDTVGLQLAVPLYAGGGIEAGERRALAELARGEAQLQALREDLALRIQQAHRGVAEARVRARALQQAVHSAQQLVRSVTRAYQAGVRTTVDVLDAEQQLAQARRDLAQTRYLALMSHLRLKALAGRADEAEIERLNACLDPAR